MDRQGLELYNVCDELVYVASSTQMPSIGIILSCYPMARCFMILVRQARADMLHLSCWHVEYLASVL